MGNVATKTARRKLGDAIQEKVFQRSLPEPMSSEQIAVMNKLTEREQERMKDLPSLEEINSKDASLGQLLDKLSASISGRRIDVSRGQDQRGMLASPSTSTSDSVDNPSHGSMRLVHGDMRPLPSHRGAAAAAAAAQHPTASPASGTGQRTAWGSRRRILEDEEAGRLPSFLLRDLLEQKNVAESSVGPRPGGEIQQSFDLLQFSKSTGSDLPTLERLMEHCCLPLVGKVDTFGHQYAFARAPLWWSRQVSGNQFKSEPWEKMIRKKEDQQSALTPPSKQVSGSADTQRQSQVEVGADAGGREEVTGNGRVI
ncbi:hypothetical protein CEUSTIGMA_g5402.t1 [Chlamydomonas eustigma]|uniref:Uncharacterized protein n=1 Tax=Chlamydomonas eustigma TaxID=1157962 RepID=A0A250X5C9_9CHLO|nr:hypothetical protein CEUSTIGMA_g5402.t1 [Chlamydomonas eustigma]|eukprot:GAX77960.1 hypothetical protein CEUSTIGMA_g5402.t1 [Chlamydomonas eustigma]